MATVAFHASSGRWHGFVLSLTNACLLCLLLALCGCAQKVMPTAVKLGQAGQEAAVALKSSVTISDDKLDATLRYIAFYNAFYDDGTDQFKPFREQGKQIIIEIDSVQQALTANTKWITSLQKAYIALGELAANDAQDNFITAYNNLNASTASLFSALNATPPSTTVSNIFSYASGQAASFVQTKKVIAASQSIRLQLDNIIKLLSDSKNKLQYTELQGKYIKSAKDAIIILISNGIISATPIIDEIGFLAKLKSAPKADKVIANNPRLQAAVTAYVIETSRQQVKSMGKAYDKSIETLVALQKQHESLEKTGDINLQNVSTIIDQLQSINAKTLR